jgi:hypothetical protein
MRKKAGELLPHTPFDQFEVVSAGHTPWTKTTRHAGTNRDWNWSTWPVDHHIPRIAHSADIAKAGAFVQQAAAAIYSSGFDASTSLAEMHKTASMVTGINSRVNRFLEAVNNIKEVRKLRRSVQNRRVIERNARKIAEILHGAWLEGRYGWRVLAFEIRDLYEAVYEFDTNRKIWTERRGFSYTEKTVTSSNMDWGLASGINTTVKEDVTSHSIRGAVASLTDISRFQINPVVTAWELIPFSFVVDFSIQVGEAIQAASLVNTSKATVASIGVKSVTQHTTTQAVVKTPRSGFTYNSSTGVFEYVVMKSVRMPTSIPFTPQISPDLFWDPLKVLDMQALYRAKRIPYLR